MYTADSTYMGTWTRKYSDGTNIGRGWTDSTGTVLNDYKGELNDKGLLAKMVKKVQSEDGMVTSVYTYTYDSFDETGNWTQATEYDEDGKVLEVQKRIYTYFKKD